MTDIDAVFYPPDFLSKVYDHVIELDFLSNFKLFDWALMDRTWTKSV